MSVVDFAILCNNWYCYYNKLKVKIDVILQIHNASWISDFSKSFIATVGNNLHDIYQCDDHYNEM